MADEQRPTHEPEDMSAPDAEQHSGAPRWVKAFGIVGILVVVAIVVALLFGGGQHGPGRHLPGGNPGGTSTQVPGDGQGGHVPPPGGHGG